MLHFNEFLSAFSEFLLIDFDRVFLEDVLGVLFEDGEVVASDVAFPDGVEFVANAQGVGTLIF